MPGVGAVTDVTGFGLLGHLLEVVRASKLTARLSMQQVPLLDQAKDLAAQGCITGASGRNWTAYGHDVKLLEGVTITEQQILCDPQTSGGLLVSVRPDAVDNVIALFHRMGFTQASVIGELIQTSNASEIIVAP